MMFTDACWNVTVNPLFQNNKCNLKKELSDKVSILFSTVFIEEQHATA